METDSPTPPSVETQVANRAPINSKKWLMSIIGLSCVMFVWLVSLVFIARDAGSAAQIVSLATIVITFLGALTGAYVSGQSFVDWKNSSTLAVMDTNSKEEKVVAETITKDIKQEIFLTEELAVHIEEEGKNAPAMKPFGMAAVGDDNVELGKEAEYDFARG